MASYGRLELLKASVGSALQQHYKNCDLVIVDDGSDTETVNWLKQLEAEQDAVRVFYQQHKGVAAARACGVEQAGSEYICILDSDDLLAPEAVGVLVSTALEQEAKLVYSGIRELRGNGSAVVQHYPRFSSVQSMLLATLLKPRLPFKHSGTLFHRETALALGSYNTTLPCKVDIDLYLKFLRAGFLPVLVNKPLVDFKMHKDSVSINRMQGIRVWLYLIDEYGPSNAFYRLCIKTVRVSSELLKRLYIEVFA